MKCKRYIYRHLAILIAVVAAIFCSCSDEFDVASSSSPNDYICIEAAMENESANIVARSIETGINTEETEWLYDVSSYNCKAATRAIPMKVLEDSIGVLGYIFPKDQVMGAGCESWADMKNCKFIDINDEYCPEVPLLWSSVGADNNLQVYAYSPYKGNSFSDDMTGYPQIPYIVPANVKEQKDIVVAEALVAPAEQKKPIQLTFNHMLTAVKFRTHFRCKVKSVAIKNVYNSGSFSFEPTVGWIVNTTGEGVKSDYIVSFGEGKEFKKDSLITSGDSTMMLIPQALPDDAMVEMVCCPYDEENGVYLAEKKFTASLKGKVWKQKKIITYILHDKEEHNFIYLDLAAANVEISSSGYKGSYYKTDAGERQKVDVSSTHSPKNVYRIYQSTDGKLCTDDNRSTTGLVDGTWVLPVYPEVMYDKDKKITWSDFITNNDSVEQVIEAWDNKDGTAGAVRNAKRSHTNNWIKITTPVECDVIIDNIYSRYQQESTARTTGSIAVHGNGTGKSTVTINYVGDNRLGCIQCNNKNSNQKLILQGTGSLTVADADFLKRDKNYSESGGDGYWSNHWNAAIGNNDSQNDCYGIVINSGTLFAGTTRAENCTAIGAGGNGTGEVTINGGVITAVASTTGTAIGGGIGFHSPGGVGKVVINGGNIYAYNKGNRWDIPSSAIGGAGSCEAAGAVGTVIIRDGYVYAESALGTAIGGGSSFSKPGGDATITITGGTVVAKSVSALGGDKGGKQGQLLLGGAGIGGGSASTGGDNPKVNNKVIDTNNQDNGGSATINISGTPTIRTGSIGGGLTSCSGGKIGSATITIKGGDIQAQFIMAKGSKGTPFFSMSGGTIHNSDVKDAEFRHVRDYGGAVYLEDGSCEITGGLITTCSAKKGGAVYVVGENSPSFKMTSGRIENCIAEGDFSDGGAVYLEGGKVSIGGDAMISRNIANGGNGGGVCVRLGDFDMGGEAEIEFNTALFTDVNIGGSIVGYGGNGGGVYVTSSSEVNVNIENGHITDNSASRKGGGVCVEITDETKVANVKIGKDDAELLSTPEMSRNLALGEGGGMYVIGKMSKVDIYDGYVKKNKVSSYVANEDVANERGMVTLYSGDVTHVEVVFDGNGGTVNDDGVTKTTIQNIVTATNSLLVTPPVYDGEGSPEDGDIIRWGYNFVKWNTRKDGNGVTYKNGDLMNLTNGMTLYAIWEAK